MLTFRMPVNLLNNSVAWRNGIHPDRRINRSRPFGVSFPACNSNSSSRGNKVYARASGIHLIPVLAQSPALLAFEAAASSSPSLLILPRTADTAQPLFLSRHCYALHGAVSAIICARNADSCLSTSSSISRSVAFAFFSHHSLNPWITSSLILCNFAFACSAFMLPPF